MNHWNDTSSAVQNVVDNFELEKKKKSEKKITISIWILMEKRGRKKRAGDDKGSRVDGYGAQWLAHYRSHVL